ncbi:hypothetical protein [Sphaerimonospora thailandensis]|uniref:Uncharacterized protein n=1 Tax=Sphaerimonospora thailandensis TaxID=795644 RepID=A0A8J3RHD6_9ACTN|nr:hypothetical protein [Sphaerimonospora thailandensis]GIH72358.1 hypothetical protein Mth01_46110 [Sphaerimonospora thailandensis]
MPCLVAGDKEDCVATWVDLASGGPEAIFADPDVDALVEVLAAVQATAVPEENAA